MGDKKAYHVFGRDRKVDFGIIRTSIASFCVAGDWGGPHAVLSLLLHDAAKNKDVTIVELTEEEWALATSKMPIACVIGEGSHIKVKLSGSVDPDLTVALREVRKGRRGG